MGDGDNYDKNNHLNVTCKFGKVIVGRITLNTLRPRQNGRHFPDDSFKCIFLNASVLISIKISLKFVPRSLINNIPALVQIMAWRRSGDKRLSEPMMVSLPTHICVTRPQWAKAEGDTCINQLLKFWSLYTGSQVIIAFAGTTSASRE